MKFHNLCQESSPNEVPYGLADARRSWLLFEGIGLEEDADLTCRSYRSRQLCSTRVIPSPVQGFFNCPQQLAIIARV